MLVISGASLTFRLLGSSQVNWLFVRKKIVIALAPAFQGNWLFLEKNNFVIILDPTFISGF